RDSPSATPWRRPRLNREIKRFPRRRHSTVQHWQKVRSISYPILMSPRRRNRPFSINADFRKPVMRPGFLLRQTYGQKVEQKQEDNVKHKKNNKKAKNLYRFGMRS